MRVCAVVVFWLFLARAVWADAFPAFFNVTGVAVEDVLNVRASPSTSASIIAKLSHDDQNIEVVRHDPDGEWGLVNIGETAGWVSLRFLERASGQVDDQLPRPLICTGTEPFWSLQIGNSNAAELLRPGDTPVGITLLDPVTASNRTDRYAIFGQSEESVYTFIFHRNMCSDGMSDRAYGLSVDLFLTEKSGVNYVTGCCSLQ